MSADAAPVSTLPVRMGALPATTQKVHAIVPQTLDDAFRLGSMIFASGLAPYSLKSKEAVCAAVMYGMEIGLPPMQAVQSIAVINNRPGIFGDAAIALVRQSGLLAGFREYVEGEGDAMAGVCEVTRRNPDGTTETLTERFTVAHAKQAGLWTKTGRNGESTPWQTYPERMLRFRARGFALRDLFADVLKGLATVEELQDIDPTPPAPTRPTRNPPAPPPAAAIAAPIEPAQDEPAAPVRRPPPPPGSRSSVPYGGKIEAPAAPEPRTIADDLEDMASELAAATTADEFDAVAEPWIKASSDWPQADRLTAQDLYERHSARFA